jgi:hypothetical protein
MRCRGLLGLTNSAYLSSWTSLIMEKTVSLHSAVLIVAGTVLGTALGFLGALMTLPATVVAAALVEQAMVLSPRRREHIGIWPGVRGQAR